MGAPKRVNSWLCSSLTPFLTWLKELKALRWSFDEGLIRKSSHFEPFNSRPWVLAAFVISAKSLKTVFRSPARHPSSRYQQLNSLYHLELLRSWVEVCTNNRFHNLYQNLVRCCQNHRSLSCSIWRRWTCRYNFDDLATLRIPPRPNHSFQNEF